MKNLLKKTMLLAGIVCTLSIAVSGCGSSRETSAEASASQEAGSEVSVSGDILKIGEMQFRMKADNKVVKEDGTIESKGSGQKVTVLYDEETTFYIRTIYGDGSSYEDTDATAEDMAEDMRVEITGYYEGKELHAVQVQLMKFE
ncbi:MAG: hypothetical protein K2N95_09995 [Lachnospiraceae bacterium]|nr:hypothetical protein [Lachnospiraceae bacterium]